MHHYCLSGKRSLEVDLQLLDRQADQQGMSRGTATRWLSTVASFVTSHRKRRDKKSPLQTAGWLARIEGEIGSITVCVCSVFYSVRINFAPFSGNTCGNLRIPLLSSPLLFPENKPRDCRFVLFYNFGNRRCSFNDRTACLVFHDATIELFLRTVAIWRSFLLFLKRKIIHWIAIYQADSVTHFALLRQNFTHSLFQADVFINAERIKIYALLAGAMVWDISRDTANIPRGELQSISRPVVNVCEALDWKRVLAVHLW